VNNEYLIPFTEELSFDFYEFSHIVIESYIVDEGASSARNDMAISSNILFA